jgi:hypothetical protein
MTTVDQSGWNEPPKKKSSAWKWVLLGCGGLLILFAAGAGIIGYLAYRSVNTDPIEAQALAQEILPIDIPQGFTRGFSMNIVGMKMAALSTASPGTRNGSSIVLMQMPGNPANQEAARQRMMDNMARRGGVTFGSGAQHRTDTFHVRGADVQAQVEEGSRDNSDFVQYSFALTGKSGQPVVLMANGGSQQITHDWVQHLLDSVH